MSLPRVYAAINAITSAFATHGVAKERINLDDGYAYRGIDDVIERLAPLLATYKLCILPRVLTRTQGERIDPDGEPLIHVTLHVAFDLVSVEDGSVHTIEAVGEALDHSDKASAKAMTSAYKHAVLHAFCIPVSGREDADRCSPGRNSAAALPAPVEGWAQWAEDIAAVIAACATREAIERLLASNRAQLSALAREQPGAYTRVGRSIAAQRKALAQPERAQAEPNAAEAKASAPARVVGAKAATVARVKHRSATPKSGATQDQTTRKPPPPQPGHSLEAKRPARPGRPVDPPRPPNPPRVNPGVLSAVEAGVLEHG